jgi:DNA-binding NtrC family response regulator
VLQTIDLQNRPIAPHPALAEEAGSGLGIALVGKTVAEVERCLILETLGHCLGNRTHAARILGISIRTLRNKLNDYMAAGIVVPEPGQKAPATS